MKTSSAARAVCYPPLPPAARALGSLGAAIACACASGPSPRWQRGGAHLPLDAAYDVLRLVELLRIVR